MLAQNIFNSIALRNAADVVTFIAVDNKGPLGNGPAIGRRAEGEDQHHCEQKRSSKFQRFSGQESRYSVEQAVEV